MKLLNPQLFIYGITALGCLCSMVAIDYFLGAEAEFLNAWEIIQRLTGRKDISPQCKVVHHCGLYGATIIMLVSNIILGIGLVHLYRIASQLLSVNN